MRLLVISYSRVHLGQMRHLVSMIRAVLQGVDKAVYWDQEIEPGVEWFDELKGSIDASSQLFVFWCAHSAASREVRREFAYAFRRRKRVVPVLLDSTPLPPRLAANQWVDFRRVVKHPSPQQERRRRALKRVTKRVVQSAALAAVLFLGGAFYLSDVSYPSLPSNPLQADVHPEPLFINWNRPVDLGKPVQVGPMMFAQDSSRLLLESGLKVGSIEENSDQCGSSLSPTLIYAVSLVLTLPSRRLLVTLGPEDALARGPIERFQFGLVDPRTGPLRVLEPARSRDYSRWRHLVDVWWLAGLLGPVLLFVAVAIVASNHWLRRRRLKREFSDCWPVVATPNALADSGGNITFLPRRPW